MADQGRVKIERLTTGIPRLDDILDGGFPQGSLNIIAGGPGVGKSIMTLQMLFHQARQENKSVYFVTISEPSIKFIRYMHQFDFFDQSLFPDKVEFFDLSAEAKSQNPLAAIETVRREVTEKEHAIVAIDSFKALRERFADAAAARSAFTGWSPNLPSGALLPFWLASTTTRK
ncbi:MAG: AAA family ATPase [Chloroflexi bacterium]|nr:AAA family ATPase [Chloroflexota bacterium]